MVDPFPVAVKEALGEPLAACDVALGRVGGVVGNFRPLRRRPSPREGATSCVVSFVGEYDFELFECFAKRIDRVGF